MRDRPQVDKEAFLSQLSSFFSSSKGNNLQRTFSVRKFFHRVTSWRTWSILTKVILSAKLSSRPHPPLASDFHGVKGFSLHMWIPTEAVGKVIGKKGAVITHIQLTTQTEVVVLTITEAGSEHWAPVIITGEPYKALQAYELIKDIAEGTN